MSWARTKELGYGQLAFRLSIDGWPEEFVTHSDMVRAGTSSDRARLLGLRMTDFVLDEQADIVRAQLDVRAWTATIADISEEVTLSLNQQPTGINWLSTAASAGETTSLTVGSTTSLPASGVVYLNTEAIEYTGKTSTTLTTLKRGKWNTLAQWHYTEDGNRQAAPEVTSRPVLMSRRRARLYVYGAGDSKTGDGTQIWLGIVASEPSYSGGTWSIRIDPVTKLMSADIATDLEDPIGIRGIYYSDANPIYVRIQEYNSATPAAATAVSAMTDFMFNGFFETQQDFVQELTTAIQGFMDGSLASTVTGTFTQTAGAMTVGNTWGLWFETSGSGTQRWLSVEMASPLDHGTRWATERVATQGGDPVITVAADTRYLYYMSSDPAYGMIAEPGTVPRTVLGYLPSSHLPPVPTDSDRWYSAYGSYPSNRIYVGAGAELTGDVGRISVDWAANGIGAGGDAFEGDVTNVDGTNGYIEVTLAHYLSSGGGPARPSAWIATSANPPTIKLGRGDGSGGTSSLKGYLTALTNQTAQYLNKGITPDLQAADLDLTGSGLDDAIQAHPLLAQRTYWMFSETPLEDVITEDSKLAGVFPALNTSGQITFHQVRFPGPGESPAATITADQILVDNGWPDYSKNPLGTINTWVLKTGYNPSEDDHEGEKFVIRDRAAYGRAPGVRSLEVAPLSVGPEGQGSYEEILSLASRALGVFGGAYATLRIQVPLTLFDVLIGDVVLLTSTKVPAAAGTRGISGVYGLVIGRRWELSEARGTLTLLMSDQRIGGYAPSAKINSESAVAGSTQWNLTLNSGYFPTGKQAEDYYRTGDKIRIVRRDSTSVAGNVAGTATAVAGNVLTVHTTPWTPSTHDWSVLYNTDGTVTADVVDSMKRFTCIAGADSEVEYAAATTQAYTFAP